MLTDDDSTPTAAELGQEAAEEGKDGPSRRIIFWGGVGLVVFILLTLASWGYIWYSQVKAGTALATQVTAACGDGTLLPTDRLCSQAKEVTKVTEQGPVGATGLQGPKGDDGEDGKDGKNGKDGKDGEPGDDGSPGANGTDGANGTNGTNGTNGLSAYELATSAGFSGTLEDWLTSLKGAKGDKGDQGDKGEPGTSAYPFTFTLTVPGTPPLQGDRTYRYTCVTPGEECTREEITQQP